jgi:hypothetical protein
MKKHGLKSASLSALKGAIKAGKSLKAWEGKQVLIWSDEHNAWWRPEGHGYTTFRQHAGVYTFEHAWGASSHCGPEKGIVYQEATPFPYQQVQKICRKLADMHPSTPAEKTEYATILEDLIEISQSAPIGVYYTHCPSAGHHGNGG